MTVPSIQRLTVSLLVLLLAIQAVAGQNYHFSNGWHAGKKRSDDNNACGFRKDVLMLVNKIILEEASRVTRQCHSVSRNLDFTENEPIGAESDNQLTEKRWK